MKEFMWVIPTQLKRVALIMAGGDTWWLVVQQGPYQELAQLH